MLLKSTPFPRHLERYFNRLSGKINESNISVVSSVRFDSKIFEGEIMYELIEFGAKRTYLWVQSKLPQSESCMVVCWWYKVSYLHLSLIVRVSSHHATKFVLCCNRNCSRGLYMILCALVNLSSYILDGPSSSAFFFPLEPPLL